MRVTWRGGARAPPGPGRVDPVPCCPPSTAGAGYSVCHVRRITATTSGRAVRVSRACRGPDSTPFRLPAPVPSPFSRVGSRPAGSRSGAGVRQAAGPARIRSEIVSANDGSDTATGWRGGGSRGAATTTAPSLPRASRTCARRLVRDPGGLPAVIEVRATTPRRCTSAWNAPVRQPTGPCLERPPPRGRPVRRVTVRPRMSRRIGTASGRRGSGRKRRRGGRRIARRVRAWRPVRGTGGAPRDGCYTAPQRGGGSSLPLCDEPPHG